MLPGTYSVADPILTSTVAGNISGVDSIRLFDPFTKRWTWISKLGESRWQVMNCGTINHGSPLPSAPGGYCTVLVT